MRSFKHSGADMVNNGIFYPLIRLLRRGAEIGAKSGLHDSRSSALSTERVSHLQESHEDHHHPKGRPICRGWRMTGGHEGPGKLG